MKKLSDGSEIETKYYDGSYCPKCASVDYDVDFNDPFFHLYSLLDLVASGDCNKCGCKFYTQLVHGPGPVETNVYHFETIVKEESK